MTGTLEVLLIMIGMSSVALLWAFSIGAALMTLGDTFSAHIDALLKRFKG